jgi:GPH family glycoside/pentoside/hexuronide:cation symporter
MKQANKWLYAFGNLGSCLSLNAVSGSIAFFYLDVVKMSPGFLTLGMTLYAIWNSINDPLAGHLSDRTRTRWGRRVPYILFGSLPMAIFFALIWIVPDGVRSNEILLFVYFLAMLFCFDGLSTVVGLNLTALFPEMYPDERDRAEICSYRQVFALLGSILGLALPPLLYTSLGWEAMGIALAVVTTISLYVSLKGIREPKHYQSEEELPVLEALKATLRNRSFVTYVIFQLMIQFALALIIAAIPFFVKYVLRQPESVASYLLFAAFGIAFPMVFVWSRLAVRLSARMAMMAAISVFALMLLPFLIVSSVWSTLLTTALVGLGLGGLVVLPDILLADVIDEDELKTGRRREGMYFGMQGLLMRGSIVLQVLVLNGTLALVGYDPDLTAAQQPALLEGGLRALFSIVPAIAAGLGVLALFAYPLYGQRLRAVRTERVSTAAASN